MKIQNIHKNTIRQRKNSERLQGTRNSVKPENDTKIKILKFQENYNKSSLKQGLEQFFKVTPCNEKCNFFILLKSVTLIQLLFEGTGSPCPYFRYIIHGKNNQSSKCMINGIYSNILSKGTVKIFHIYMIPIQWMKKMKKDTKFVTVTNSCNLKKVAVNPVYY